jgi:hypothetical protein
MCGASHLHHTVRSGTLGERGSHHEGRVTLALAAGANTRELMERMGHTSPAVALRYQHVMAGRDQAIAAALDELVQAAAELPTEKASGTVVARTRRAKPEGPGGRAARGR